MIFISILNVFGVEPMPQGPIAGSIHEFTIQALNSEDVIDMSNFAGKKVLIVNVASNCGFTHQYSELQKLYEQYQDQLVIVGFPCNQFLMQESGSEEKIANFCEINYGVTFPMTKKINVKGRKQHPIYKWLTTKALNGKDDFKVTWNFNKFLLDEQGQILAHFDSKVGPLDSKILDYLSSAKEK